MKQCLSLLLIFCMLAPFSLAQDTKATSAPSVSPANLALKDTPDGKAILQDGTPVRLRLSRTLSSAECKTGDRIDFEVMDPIVLNGITIIPQGWIAWGTVTDAEHKKSMGRAGKLNIALVAVKLSNSEKANLTAIKDSKGASHTGVMTGAIVATAIVLWPAAPLFLFIHGKDITIPRGTEITAYIDGDKVFVPIAETAPNFLASAQPTAVTTNTKLTLVSSPNGADIEVDGAFVGSTPSTVTLAAGDHTVGVSKRGYQLYEKKLHTSGGRVNLHADLDVVGQ